ncbi:MAG: DUF3179 domain-containing protein [Thermoleophilaceae bacterium]
MRRRFALIAACLGLVAAGCGGAGDAGRGGGGESGGAESTGADGLRVPTAEWETDFSRHNVPLSEFTSGGPGRDGIPPIDKPKFVSQESADEWLADNEPVLVVELGGQARAYPIQILMWHEVVNDELAGRPIAVTFCPLCNSSLVFDRRLDGRELTFGTTGNLRNSDLVMWDRQTESWWQQLTGEAVVGELTDKRLRALASQTLSFKDFRESLPSGDVLSRDTGFERTYGDNPYEGYDTPDQQPFLFEGETDERLAAKERVAAVFIGDDAAVVPFSRLRKNPVASFDLAGTPVAVMFKAGVASALDDAKISESDDVGTSAAFDRRLEGRTLDFERRGDAIVDRQTRSTWDITGRATDGPLRGKRLKAVRSDQQFWFALAAFLPDARIVA